MANPGYRFLLTPRWIALLLIALLIGGLIFGGYNLLRGGGLGPFTPEPPASNPTADPCPKQRSNEENAAHGRMVP